MSFLVPRFTPPTPYTPPTPAQQLAAVARFHVDPATASDEEIDARIEELSDWVNGARCECGDDFDEGYQTARCEWDDVSELDRELGNRPALAQTTQNN